MFLDGDDVNWTPREDIGVDRWFYDLHTNKSLKGGKHDLAFELGEGALVGQAQLCSVEVIEYGSAEEYVVFPAAANVLIHRVRFNTTEGYIGAFPTYVSVPATDFS